MARISDMHKKWMKEPKYKKAYDALEEEFVLAGAVMDVRNRAGLTRGTGPEDGHDAARCRPAGKRALPPVDADAGASGGSRFRPNSFRKPSS